ncbi:MAG TPA: flagellar hook-associated protein 3, partial [Gammaproteobacteria bacterium]|nr:flagellar hook-associated protein 3 [Gammaproteobacteria bacterium]
MRISTAQMQSQAVRSMMDRQTELSYTQQQVATGKRILSPSDDVIGSTQVIALQQSIDISAQYQKNADMAESRLATEENALTQTINVLQRSREVAIQGNNGSLSAANRAALATEIRQNLAEVLALANTTDGNGEYVFAGYNVGTAPFAEVENPVGSGLYDYNYSGDNGQRNLQIGAARQIPVGDPGSDVFVNIPEGGGGTR